MTEVRENRGVSPMSDHTCENETMQKPEHASDGSGGTLGGDELRIPTKKDEVGVPAGKGSQFRLQKHSLLFFKQVKSRKHAFLKSLIHVPALAITAGVLSLTFGNVFWRRPSEELNDILYSLQFAAQFHAGFIVISFSAMLLHYVHHQLVSKRGVPLGFVGSVFQLGTIGYLFQRDVYSLRLRYILLLLPACLLVTLTGPASAITMLPRLRFWNLDNTWLGKGSLNFQMYFQGNEKDLYPETLSASNLPPACFLGNASLESQCPSYGMRHWLLNDDRVSMFPGETTFNRTIQGNWVRYMVGQTSGKNTNLQSLYATSTLSNFFGNALFAYEDLVSDTGRSAQTILGVDNAGTLQSKKKDKLGARYDLTLRGGRKPFPSRKPVVEVECAGNTRDKTLLPLPHGSMIFSPWTVDPIKSAQWSISASDYTNLRGDLNSSTVNSSWIYNEQFGEVKPSLGAVFLAPEVLTRSSCYSCAEKSYNFSSYTCTIDARWMATKAFSDVAAGKRAIFDSAPNPVKPFEMNGDLEKAAPLNPLYFDESWVKALEVPWVESIIQRVPTNRTILDTIGQKCLEANSFINSTLLGRQFDQNEPHRITKDPMQMLTCLQKWIAIYITEAISHTHDSIPAYFVTEGHNLDFSYNKQYYKRDPYLVQNLYDEVALYASNHGVNDTRVHNINKAQFEDPTKFTELHISTSRWGYGYGFQGSRLIYVAVLILLLHAAICIVYITWILWKGDYRDAGYDSIGGLIAMTMASNEPGNQGTDERDLKRKRSERVVVREVTADGVHAPVRTKDDQKERRLVLTRANTRDEESAA